MNLLTPYFNIFRFEKITAGTKLEMVLIYIARIALRLQMAEKAGGGHNVPPQVLTYVKYLRSDRVNTSLEMFSIDPEI